LGWLADRLSLQLAYGMVIVLMIAAVAIVINNRGLPAHQIPVQR
jgi:hypothetical protein